MYLAHFASEQHEVLTAAFKWPISNDALVPILWVRTLLQQSHVEYAIRIEFDFEVTHAVLMLSANASTEAELQDCCNTLLQNHKPAGLIVPSTADEFDAFAEKIPTSQMRINYAGYYHAGSPLACDFRLYSMLQSCLAGKSGIYQINLRRYCTDVEAERSVRKYIAWLDIEQPFSKQVRLMQRSLVQRLLHPGVFACEFIAVHDQKNSEICLKQINTHFKETTGRIGFPEPPIETGDYSELLTTCYNPAEATDFTLNLPCQAASIFSVNEATMLLASNFTSRHKTGSAESSSQNRPDVFISYASSDFGHAASACRHLEDNGFICWIAPRDIDRDILPYPEAIQRAISQVRAVVVMLSDYANLSVHIPRELDLALERKLFIFPVRLNDVLPEGQLNYLLRTCQWVNASSNNFHEAMEILISRLNKLPR